MRELEDEIEDLKTKLDKTEYIIQYKEKVWKTYLVVQYLLFVFLLGVQSDLKNKQN